MKLKFLHIAVILNTFLLFSCEDILLHEEFKNTRIDNFNAFWSEFDRYYGAFEAKGINWDSLKIVYRTGINEHSTDHELFNALCGLLATLNDGHANIHCPAFGTFSSYHNESKSYFSDFYTQDTKYQVEILNLISHQYLGTTSRRDTVNNYLFMYGKIDYQNLIIGYIFIGTFKEYQFPIRFINEAIDYFGNSDAVIIDIRFNGGGQTEPFVQCINLFSSEKKLYMKSKFRNGPEHNNFSPFYDHFTNPNPIGLKNIPMAILINGFTASSSEYFLLALKTQNDVISVGDTTWGAFSSQVARILPNGWQYRLGAQIIFTPEGVLFTDSNGQYLEGIGIPPDYYMQDSKQAIDNNQDLVLDLALEKLNELINNK